MVQSKSQQSDFTFQKDLDVEGFTPTAAEMETIQTEVDRIEPLISEFPTQILYVNIDYHSPSRQYGVKLALVLPGQTFATKNVSESWQPSLESCVNKMIHRIEHYKATMSGERERGHAVAGTKMEVEPAQRLDGERVRNAFEEDNYIEFRQALYPLESSLRARIGRWIQRYPQIEAMIGQQLTIADVVEETFMLAFDRFDQWPEEEFFGHWVESLIDPAVKAIVRDPDGELERIGFLRSWDESETA